MLHYLTKGWEVDISYLQGNGEHKVTRNNCEWFKIRRCIFHELIRDQYSYYVETNELIRSSSQLVGFYVIRTLILIFLNQKIIKYRRLKKKLKFTDRWHQKLDKYGLWDWICIIFLWVFFHNVSPSWKSPILFASVVLILSIFVQFNWTGFFSLWSNLQIISPNSLYYRKSGLVGKMIAKIAACINLKNIYFIQ